MAFKCNFLEEFNQCPFYKSPSICTSEKTACAFQEDIEAKQVTSSGRPVYIRKKRWYEELPSRQNKKKH